MAQNNHIAGQSPQEKEVDVFYYPWNQPQGQISKQRNPVWGFHRIRNFISDNQKTTDAQKAEARVRKLARKSAKVLFHIKTVFPFDFFPDSLTISENKLDITNSYFFFSNQTKSIPLRDIATVEVQTSILFATLKIINLRYPLKPIIFNFFWNHDAIKAKNIIDGLLVTMSHGADVAAIEPKRLLKQIEKVGDSYAT